MCVKLKLSRIRQLLTKSRGLNIEPWKATTFGGLGRSASAQSPFLSADFFLFLTNTLLFKRPHLTLPYQLFQ